MPPLIRLAGLVAFAALLAGCVSAPAPQYQPAIANTETLLQKRPRLSVGEFSAAPDVNNRSLSIRGSQLQGGRDGTFSTYLHDAAVTELTTAACYDEGSPTRLTGRLTRNELNAAVKTGTATVGAEFTLTRSGQVVFQKTLATEHQWESSFMGAVAIPFAMDNYAATVQKLLGKLFADPEFIAAVNSRPAPPPASREL